MSHPTLICASCGQVQGRARAACCGSWRCTYFTPYPDPCFLCPCSGPGAGGLLRRLALYLFTPAVTGMLHTYGFGELPPQVPPAHLPLSFLPPYSPGSLSCHGSTFARCANSFVTRTRTGVLSLNVYF